MNDSFRRFPNFTSNRYRAVTRNLPAAETDYFSEIVKNEDFNHSLLPNPPPQKRQNQGQRIGNSSPQAFLFLFRRSEQISSIQEIHSREPKEQKH
ncbi:MAG: hypothetical protein E7028_09535 [Planctomycetaceae bacterium]|nr:hypothetical protein [Planctomycetaceae bacterium]MDO4425930.1 hypothetical protein [Planctomycetia bacterium]